MSKIRCKHCGKEIDDYFKKCPFCQKPIGIWGNNRSIVIWFIISACSVLFLIILLAPSDKQTILKVTPYNLYSEFAKNEIAAEKKYKGGRIEVSGTVKSIGRSNGELFVRVGLTGTVYCSFKNKHAADLAKVNKWDKVTIQGKFDKFFFSVCLNNCRLISHTPNAYNS